MAKVRLKEKTDAGHKILHPETLALNVITGTGNVQNDITNLMNEVGKLGNQIIEVKFKIEKETIEEEDLPILNMYDFDGNKITYDKTKKYYGKLVSRDSFDFQGAETRIFFNNDYYYIDVKSLGTNGVSTTSTIASESFSKNQIITLEYLKSTDSIIASPDSFNPFNVNVGTNALGVFTRGQIATTLDDYTYNHSRVPYIFNAVNTYSNDFLLSNLLSQWNKNGFCLIKNLKFTNYDFAGASGNIYGTMFFKLRRASADIPLESYRLNVRIEFSPAMNNVKSIERDFRLTKNATTGAFTILTSEIFYDENQWTFNIDTYYASITNLIGTYPISGWIDWVDIDSKATNLVIVLEHVGNLIATFDVSLRVLKIANDYQYNLNAGTTWNVIRLHNNKIQISSPTNGAGESVVKLINAFFYK